VYVPTSLSFAASASMAARRAFIASNSYSTGAQCGGISHYLLFLGVNTCLLFPATIGHLNSFSLPLFPFFLKPPRPTALLVQTQ